MKTYSIIYAFLALVVIGCSNSTDSEIDDKKEEFFNANYILLQKGNGILSSQPLNASKDKIGLSEAESSFMNVPLPTTSFSKESIYAYYSEIPDCSGQITIHDFSDDSSNIIDVFGELLDCSLTVTSMAIHGDKGYISFSREETSKINRYFVRIIDLSTSEGEFVDVELDKKPLQMVFTNNRLFVLTIDLEITDENALAVIDGTSNTLIHEIALGYDVEQIFADTDLNLIISYEELHTVLNSTSMAVQYIGYEDGKEPLFHSSTLNGFDNQGRLFYKRPTDDSVYANIPAIYDFGSDLAILYYYENFLTTSQLEFEFKIGDTTMVGFDDKNGIMLVGYQKIDNENKGGLLRVQLEPTPEFLDNLDLDAVPMQIFYLN